MSQNYTYGNQPQGVWPAPRPNGSRTCRDVDIHELQTRMIMDQGGKQESSTVFIQQNPQPAIVQSQPKYGIEDYEFYLDSVYRDSLTDSSTGQLKFNLSPNNNNQDVSNIIEMRIGEFYFPRFLNTAATSPDFYYFRRVLVQVVEAPNNQAILVDNSVRFHFEMEVAVVNSVAVLLRPIKNVFYFQKPVQSFSTITLRFLMPMTYTTIPLPPDTLYSFGGVGAGQIDLLPNTTTTSIAFQLGSLALPYAPPAPGIAVFITGFDSGDPAQNLIVNNPSGLFVTNIDSSSTFTIAGIAFPLVQAVVTPFKVIVGINRIAFPLRFTTIKNGSTQQLTPTHD